MEFSGLELSAVMQLAVRIAAVDGKIAEEERTVMFAHVASFGMEPDEFARMLVGAKAMKPKQAIVIVSGMNEDQKRYVAAYLGLIVAADGIVEDSELKLWSLISVLCDLPIMSIGEAKKIMKNELL